MANIFVKSKLEGGKVALWERDPDHPDGEVFVASDQPVEVAETALVNQKLRDGALVRVDKPTKAETADAARVESRGRGAG